MLITIPMGFLSTKWETEILTVHAVPGIGGSRIQEKRRGLTVYSDLCQLSIQRQSYSSLARVTFSSGSRFCPFSPEN